MQGGVRIFSDNPDLARWIQGLEALMRPEFADPATPIEAATSTRSQIGTAIYAERMRYSGGDIALEWRHLGQPFMTRLEPNNRFVGRWSVYSCLVPAAEASLTAFGVPAGGQAFPDAPRRAADRARPSWRWVKSGSRRPHRPTLKAQRGHSVAEPVVNPNKVHFSGENPFLRLKLSASGPDTTVCALWRAYYSPAGAGHALFIRSDATDGEILILTDNEALLRWVQQIEALLRPDFGNTSLPFTNASFAHAGDTRDTYRETAKAPGADVELSWSGLGGGFLISLEPGNDVAADWGVGKLHAPRPERRVDGQRPQGTRNGFPRADGRKGQQHRRPCLRRELVSRRLSAARAGDQRCFRRGQARSKGSGPSCSAHLSITEMPKGCALL